MHLSRENNQPSIAVRTLAAALDAKPENDIFTQARTDTGLRILVASQDCPISIL